MANFQRVINPTGEPIGPFDLNGKEYVFQPDQEKCFGTFYAVDSIPDMEGADTPEERARRKKQIKRILVHDKDRPARNYEDVPEDLVKELRTAGAQKRGAHKLIISEDRQTELDNRIKSMTDHEMKLKMRIAQMEATLAAQEARAKVQREAEDLEQGLNDILKGQK